MDLKEISWPMTISLWMMGHGVMEIPLGKPRKFLSILYTSALFIIHFYIVCFVMNKMDIVKFVNTNSIGIQIYKLINYLNIGLILFMDILLWTRAKDLDTYFVRMNAVIKVMERLGMEENHGRHLQFQYIQYCVLCFEILVSSASSVWIVSEMAVTTKLFLTYGIFYPITSLHVTNVYFVSSVRYIGTKFEQLNENLSDRLKTLSKTDGTAEHIKSEENLCNLIKSVRQIHLELMRLLKHLNQIFDEHLLISITITVVFITSYLLNIYNIVMGTIFDFETSIRMAGVVNVFSFYCFKIFIIGLTCGATSSAIEEFTMQLIQNPVSFTAYEFLTLDYPFIFQVAASVTTYMIILIQMNSSIVDHGQVNTTISIQEI